jgi:hypothetical protein
LWKRWYLLQYSLFNIRPACRQRQVFNILPLPAVNLKLFNIIAVMETVKYTCRLFAAMVILFALQSCNHDRDDQGRLLTRNVTTSSGGLKLTPMKRSDSASVERFQPDTIFYKGKPYTGPIGQHNEHENLTIDGYVKNGLLDSTWKFYYAIGGLMMEGKYKNGMDVGLWQSYFGFGKHKITKLYDDYGYMLMRIEYYDNGRIKNYQNVRAPMFDNKERNYSLDQHGGTISLYVEDSVLIVKQGETTERVGKNVFQEGGKGVLDVAK